MAVGATSSSSDVNVASSPASSVAADATMTSDRFLKLLVAQMKNQDPMNPMDGTQMAAQLAQFSSVEQLTQINEALASQSTGQTGLATLLANNGALGAVGKQVVVGANAVDVTKGAPTQVMADIPADAKTGVLHVYDANGTEVATQDLGFVSPGRRAFNVSASTKLTAGTYRYVVETTGTSGEAASAATYVAGRVDGVRFTPQGPVITMNGVAVPYMAVTELTD